MAKPSGSVFLCSGVPLDNKYENTIKFTSPEEQLAYFSSKAVKTYQYTSYIRKKDNILVDYHIDDITNVNYLYYRASSSSKWYFCFVTSKRYKSEKCTEISVEIDVLQSYHFNYNLKPSFIERGHVNRWEANKSPIFSYTEEGLSYGSDYTNETSFIIKRNDNVVWFLCLMSYSKEFHEGSAIGPYALNNVPSPYLCYLIPHRLGEGGALFRYGDGDISNISEFMKAMTDSAIGSAVKELSYIPYLPFDIQVSDEGVLTGVSNGVTLIREGIKVSSNLFNSSYLFMLRVNPVTSAFKDTLQLVSFERTQGLDMLTNSEWSTILSNSKGAKYDKRIESKLLTHPYRYNILTNWKTQPLIVKNEYLPSNIKIKMSKTLSFNNPARYWIEGYKNDINGRGNSIVEELGLNLPIVSDQYYEYMLQNKNQILNSMITSIANVGVGTATGGLAGGVSSGLGAIESIAGELSKQADIKNLPDTILNSNDSSLALADKNIYMSFYRYKIEESYAQRLAHFWHMYGYKVNDVVDDMEAFITSRERYNYIKTINVNITGDFDNEDLAAIKEIFNNGVTFWHYYNDFKILDYSYMNIEKSLK